MRIRLKIAFLHIYVEFGITTILRTHVKQQSGAEEACWAHNPEVGGSKPPSATYNIFNQRNFSPSCYGNIWRFPIVPQGIFSLYVIDEDKNKINKKGLSEVGFEPTPTSVDCDLNAAP